MGKLLTLFTWGFVLVNAFPLFWMAWCSLMGNNEILQGRLIPEPYRSDVAYFSTLPDGRFLAATINGEVYRFSSEKPEQHDKKINLNAVSASYQADAEDLWILSANEGLLQFDLHEWSVARQWTWDYFRDSYQNMDHTEFVMTGGSVSGMQFARLAKRLNLHPLVPLSVDGPSLSSLSDMDFSSSPELINQLNSLLASPAILRTVLTEWKKTTDWTNPRIDYLMKKKRRTEQEDRELFRWCLSERFPSELTRYRVAPWEEIWVNRVPGNGSGTSVLKVGEKICVGIWWDSYPGLAIIDSAGAQTARWVTVGRGLPSTSIQRLIKIDSASIMVLHDLGLSWVDVNQGTIRANYLFGEFGLPYLDGRDVRVALVDTSTMLLAYGQDGLLFDFRNERTTRLEPEALHGISSEITSLVLDDSRMVWLGLSDGLLRIPLTAWMEGQSLGRLRVQGNVVNSLRVFEDKVYLGGLQGLLEVLDSQGVSMFRTKLPAGPFHLHWRNYQDLWRTIPFGSFLFNSIVISLSVVVLCIVLASMASYVLARFEFRGLRLLNLGILATQMVPGVLYLIPVFILYTVIQKILLVQIVNTYAGIILVYTVFFLPIAIWLLRGFFSSLPRELEEAAVIDGCSPFAAFWRITLPAALPGIVATAIYIFLLAWDELMFAWVLSTDISTATIPVGIRMYAGQFGNRFDLLMAAATVATLPVMILFFVMQRQIVSGLTGGSVKNG